MAYNEKGAAIGGAAKIAADLVSVAASTGQDLDTLVGLWASTFETVTGAVLQLQDEAGTYPAQPAAPAPVAAAEARVQQAFPGTTVVAPPSAGPAPFPAAPAPAPVPAPAAPAAIPGATQGGGNDAKEQIWNQFFNDIANGVFADQWSDYRVDKKSPRGPDFKHKSWTLPGEKYPVGLWLSDRSKIGWVDAKLREFGL